MEQMAQTETEFSNTVPIIFIKKRQFRLIKRRRNMIIIELKYNQYNKIIQ